LQEKTRYQRQLATGLSKSPASARRINQQKARKARKPPVMPGFRRRGSQKARYTGVYPPGFLY